MLASVVSLSIGDEADAWRAGGFTVDDEECSLGGVVLRFVGGRGEGITGWDVFHPDLPAGGRLLDGLDTTIVGDHPGAPASMPTEGTHPNGTTGLDHIVVSTPDIERTTAEFATIGVEPRRTRDTTAGDAPLRQRFFRMGTIIEVIGPPVPDQSEAPARFWGLALVTEDMDATAASLGDRLGQPKDAVQPGRRIATLRTRDLGISVPVAFMTPHLR